MPTDDIQINLLTANRPLLTDDLDTDKWTNFLSIGFSHHYEILINTKSLDKRFFYIEESATELPDIYKDILPNEDELRKLM